MITFVRWYPKGELPHILLSRTSEVKNIGLKYFLVLTSPDLE
jgi:hypothetical protein